ncbi:multiple epidermal growth factor-like domains protein 10 [Ostrea edulis]|uniref:multiple epidermal growth factor-like domains protein 10 n=1 Tax=Ostrea edulis TaxID=37623 RepID=UPI0024AF9620|nr:multiple epidermal growth factor-like domains protein 10 [Ostrea edulis]
MKVCPVNHYVLNGYCIQCGHCKGDSSCNRTTGRCDDGCQENWSGTRCDEIIVDIVEMTGHAVEQLNDVLMGMIFSRLGLLVNECNNHFIDRIQTVEICRPGLYGGDCNQRCGKCKSRTICKDDTGYCPQGCQDNWSGPRCDECIPYKYGPNCAFDCGHCKDGRPCSTGNGICRNGCEEGWGDVLSSKLDSQDFTNSDKSPVTGLYVAIGVLSTLFTITVIVLVYKFRKHRQQPSQRHDNNPPQNFVNHIEMKETHDYDKLGVRDTDEYQELPPIVADQPPQERHAYGDDCNQQCGKCKSGTVCKNDTGYCQDGCQENWNGTRCIECVLNTYEFNGECVPCGHCKGNIPCDKTTGRFQNGCSDQRIGDICKLCKPGLYGEDCSHRCGKCKSGTICHNINGVCPQGCQENWDGPKCGVCSPYKYGPNCAFDCGHCKDGVPCSTGNGSCLTGCEEGWGDISCLTASSRSDRQGPITTGQKHKSLTTGLYVTIGVLSTLLTITMVVVIVLVHIVRKQSQLPSQQHGNNPPQSFVYHIEMEETHDYDKLGVRDTDDYQELPTVVADQLPHDRHASDSNYINSTLQ